MWEMIQFDYTPEKLTWQWKNNYDLKMYLLLSHGDSYFSNGLKPLTPKKKCIWNPWSSAICKGSHNPT